MLTKNFYARGELVLQKCSEALRLDFQTLNFCLTATMLGALWILDFGFRRKKRTMASQARLICAVQGVAGIVWFVLSK